MPYQCEFCENMFTSKSYLNHHQKNAKYCLIIQGEQEKAVFICKYCDKHLSSEKRLKTHYEICNSYSIDGIKKRYEEKIMEKDKIIDELKQTVKDLQSKLENIAVQAVSRPTTTTKNTQINNYIQKMECITDEHIKDQAQHLTIEHIQKGPEGYAEYALEYPLKNRIVCVDYARRKVKFKDREGNVITDPEMASVATKLFESIKDRNKALIFSYGTELRERFGDEMDTVVKLLEYKSDVENSADGSKPDFYHDFVRSVCGKTIME